MAKATVELTLKVTLPLWRQGGHVDPDVRLIWDTLDYDIRRHEEARGIIAKNHARELEDALNALRPQKTCAAMAEKAKQTTQKVLAANNSAQDEFGRVEIINFQSRISRLLQYRIQQIEGRVGYPNAARVRRPPGPPQATPSFFCRLVEEVVYWNTIRSPGLATRLAACAISAASWKPDRISFSLPG